MSTPTPKPGPLRIALLEDDLLLRDRILLPGLRTYVRAAAACRLARVRMGVPAPVRAA